MKWQYVLEATRLECTVEVRVTGVRRVGCNLRSKERATIITPYRALIHDIELKKNKLLNWFRCETFENLSNLSPSHSSYGVL
ncbi:hypothetical protein V1478_006852 [Vespula squamosa]|uniref:Uncharacterized protein n=1 Tax=Vespula squamosa TaxID=30214 RepID=A0ABD2B1J9_VESSQ